jgi:hypothetical protein
MSDVVIRQISSLDYNSLIEFLSAFPEENRSHEQWLQRLKHWWDENPAFDENWIRGFVITDNNCLVGFVGSFPTLIKYGNQIVQAFNGTTWRVLEGYRNYSIDLWFKNRELSNLMFSFNTTPNDYVIKLIKKLKYSLLPWGDSSESLFILKPLRFIKVKVSAKYGFCAYAFALGISLRQLFILRNQQVYNFQKLQSADFQFDILWNKTSNISECTNVRTSEIVNWYTKNKLLIGIYRDNILIGYGIFSRNKTNQLSEICLVDIWLTVEESLNKVIPELVSYAITLGHSVEVDFIRFPHFTSAHATAFRQTGLLNKQIIRKNYYRIPDNWHGEVTERNSYFCMLQGDYDI